MTILYATRRPTFAVIGADRRFNVNAWKLDQPDQRADYTGAHTKVTVHSTQSIAFGTAGLAILGGKATQQVVADIVDSAPQLPLLFLGALLQAQLTALVTNEKATWPSDFAQGGAAVQVALAAAGEGDVQLLVVVGGDNAMSGLAHRGFLNEPKTLPGFYSSGRYATDEGKFGPEDADADQVVEHVKAAILDGIETEKRLLGENQQVGDGLDIVVVDSEGARIVESLSLEAGAPN